MRSIADRLLQNACGSSPASLRHQKCFSEVSEPLASDVPCSPIARSGAHDNGYTSTLNYLQNEGLIEKVILLRGYKELAYEIKGLQLPHIDIEGLFMKKKLYTHPSKKTNSAQSAPATPPESSNDFDKARSKASTPAKHNNAQTTSFNKKARPVAVDQVRCRTIFSRHSF